ARARAGARVRRAAGAVRAAVLDAAALGGRIAAGWIVSAPAWAALDGGPDTALLAGAVLACGAAFAAGLATRVSGVLLLAAAVPLDALVPGLPELPGLPAVGAAGVPAAQASASGGAAPWWVALAAVCLLGELLPGRLSADALLAKLRTRARGRRIGALRDRTGRQGTRRRPEEAPPLPYPGGKAALTRPSRI
ncbi:hypothetical protein, partial [Streptomonospora sediminis]